MTSLGKGAGATWLRTGLVVIGLYAVVMVCPDRTVDSWQIFNPKKVALMVFALALIQALGEFLRSILGDRRGAIVGGFLAGLVSSTAATATIARRRLRGHADTNRLTFLSATLAMMFEGLVLVSLGADGLHGSLLILFLGPMALNSAAIVLLARKAKDTPNEPRVTAGIDLVALLKLSIFIVGIISLSKVMQIFAGQSGLLILTFVVSLFEIHGSMIANIQLHDAGTFGVSLLGGLLAVSIAASVISKCGLVYFLAESGFRRDVFRYTVAVLAALVVSWSCFMLIEALLANRISRQNFRNTAAWAAFPFVAINLNHEIAFGSNLVFLKSWNHGLVRRVRPQSSEILNVLRISEFTIRQLVSGYLIETFRAENSMS